jgi:predicted MFS family arabinose efflux permease
LSYTSIGLILAGVGAGGVLYAMVVPWLLRHLGPRRMLAVAGCLIALNYVLLSVVPVSWVAPFVVLLGIGFFMMHNTLQTQATEMAPHARGSAIALFAFSLFLAQAIGVWVFGFLVDVIDYRMILSGAGIGLAVLAWSIRRRLPSAQMAI